MKHFLHFSETCNGKSERLINKSSIAVFSRQSLKQMKGKILAAVLLLFCSCWIQINAQVKESTPSNEVWYTIKSNAPETDAARYNKIFTVSGDLVIGQLRDDENLDTQLWKFIKQGEGYTIVNKATGKCMTTLWDSGKKAARLAIAESTDILFLFRTFEKDGETYSGLSVSSSVNPNDPNDIYLHQGNNGYSYSVITVGDRYSSGTSSQFTYTEELVTTSIAADEQTTITPKVVDGRIVLPEGIEFSVFDTRGNKIAKDRKLERGIYFVKTSSSTEKVLIR